MSDSFAGAGRYGVYRGENLAKVAFPLGGIGAGMVCLEGTGAISHVSLRHKPEVFNEPLMFSALHVQGEGGNASRVLEGPVPTWKIMFPWGREYHGSGGGGRNKTYGLPHFADAEFSVRFPFATVALKDRNVPLDVTLTGWSPFIPGNSSDSSMPMGGLEYRFKNTSTKSIKAEYSFHSQNFMGVYALNKLPENERPASGVRPIGGGFELFQDGTGDAPWGQGSFCAASDDPETKVNCRWFRGGWFDPLTLVWKSVAKGETMDNPEFTEGDPSPGGSLYVPLELEPGEEKTVRVRLSWYVPASNIRIGQGLDDEEEKKKGECSSGCECGCSSAEKETHSPWYAGRFDSMAAVDSYWRSEYERMKNESKTFSDCFYNTTLPPEVVDAVAANLTILKSPTVMRQKDGRLWAWEGCCDDAGCCAGSCTHVWNYAQALPHLFPDLEQSLRETEFGENQDSRGHQNFRACLPIRPNTNSWHAAADGQLGGIMKIFREWRVSGDINWLRGMWVKVRASLDYCINTWDPDREGILKEPHHNTYDIEFWGPDGMCGSFYLGALKAAELMGAELGEDVAEYTGLFEKGKRCLETELYDGEYFYQKIRWSDLNAPDPVEASRKTNDWNVNYSNEARELLQKEGPKYQYGAGCLSDGVLGAWMAEVCGVGEILDKEKVKSNLKAIFKYNFRRDLSEHANPQRPTYALGSESGLLLCSWPKSEAL
ncbi:MAG: hypothetical protein JXR97_01340, partial [Planctomycetes bacterium]|nr:hypothetical protein [Planctomycetota bacterium]